MQRRIALEDLEAPFKLSNVSIDLANAREKVLSKG